MYAILSVPPVALSCVYVYRALFPCIVLYTPCFDTVILAVYWCSCVLAHNRCTNVIKLAGH
ncbi:hypothetical protein SERLA73DRAFT_191284, partial [Serpula lacrymans var. lacrymans S7.3]